MIVWLLLSVGCLLLAIGLFVVLWRVHGQGATHRRSGASARSHDDGLTTSQVVVPLAATDPRRMLYALALAHEVPVQAPGDEEQGAPSPSTAAVDIPLLQSAANVLRAQQLPERFIPRRPHLLPQLMGAINDPQASARHLARIIGQDPVLAASLLRVANSPVYRLQARTVDSIERAVTLVGIDGIRQIISASLVQPVMRMETPAWPRFSTLVWEHAVLSAAAAADHARGIERGDVFAAQLGGLLEGLGATMVLQVLLEQQRVQRAEAPPAEAVMGLLCDWSGQVASRVARQWELPSDLVPALLGAGADATAAQASLQRSLAFGREAAVLVMLQRQGRIDADGAIERLEQQQHGDAHAVQWIWRRLGEATLALGTRSGG